MRMSPFLIAGAGLLAVAMLLMMIPVDATHVAPPVYVDVDDDGTDETTFNMSVSCIDADGNTLSVMPFMIVSGTMNVDAILFTATWNAVGLHGTIDANTFGLKITLWADEMLVTERTADPVTLTEDVVFLTKEFQAPSDIAPLSGSYVFRVDETLLSSIDDGQSHLLWFSGEFEVSAYSLDEEWDTADVFVSDFFKPDITVEPFELDINVDIVETYNVIGLSSTEPLSFVGNPAVILMVAGIVLIVFEVLKKGKK